jgi:hypothetical protein
LLSLATDWSLQESIWAACLREMYCGVNCGELPSALICIPHLRAGFQTPYLGYQVIADFLQYSRIE